MESNQTFCSSVTSRGGILVVKGPFLISWMQIRNNSYISQVCAPDLLTCHRFTCQCSNVDGSTLRNSDTHARARTHTHNQSLAGKKPSESCRRSHGLVRKSEGNRSGVVRALHPLFERQLAAGAPSEGRFDLGLRNLQPPDTENLAQLPQKFHRFQWLPLQTSWLYTARLLSGSSAR